jgi:hypothetical protein
MATIRYGGSQNSPIWSEISSPVSIIYRSAAVTISSLDLNELCSVLHESRIGQAPRTVLPKPRMFLPVILTVGHHWLPVIACKRAIVIPDIADTPIEIRERCPLFPSVGNPADGRQGAVFHSYVNAACAIGQARMLPALSWLAPATALHADANMPAPRTAKIVSARLHSRSQSRSLIRNLREAVHRYQKAIRFII